MITRLLFKNIISLRNLLKQSKGFTMIELVIALVILLLIVLAFTPLFVGSLQQIYYARDKTEALHKSQAQMEVSIFYKETIDGHQIVFEFYDDPNDRDDPNVAPDVTVTVPGGFVEIEQSEGDATAWLSSFLPYVPSINLHNRFLTEGYDGEALNTILPMVVFGRDTRLEIAQDVDIYTRQQFEEGSSAEYFKTLSIIPQGDLPPGFDEYAEFDLPAAANGLTNANSPYIVEANWMVEQISVNVRARLHVSLPAAVAVGDAGEIVVSPDANETWNIRNNDVSIGSNINDVIWATFRYVAVTSNGKILVWGNQEEPQEIDIAGLGNISLNSIAKSDDKLIAVGDEGTIVISHDDGKSWTLSPPVTWKNDDGEEEELTSNLTAIGWNNHENEFMENEFMAFARDGYYIRSGEPIVEWEVNKLDFYPSPRIFGLAHGEGAWVAVGGRPPADPADPLQRRIYRENGNNEWETVDSLDQNHTYYNDIVYVDAISGPKFIAVGTEGLIMISDDGINWEEDSGLALNNELYSIIWDDYFNNQYVIVGDSGTVITGYSGDWTEQGSGSSECLKGVTIKWQN